MIIAPVQKPALFLFARQAHLKTPTKRTLNRSITLKNRQRSHRINSKMLRKIIAGLLDQLEVHECVLSILLVTEREMTLLNETFLRHKGSTDVITFNYLDRPSQSSVIGDIVVCVDEAASQARRFRTTWQSELVRYIVHGVLHLLGYDDRGKPSRQKMRRAENAVMQQLSTGHRLSAIAGRATLRKSR